MGRKSEEADQTGEREENEGRMSIFVTIGEWFSPLFGSDLDYWTSTPPPPPLPHRYHSSSFREEVEVERDWEMPDGYWTDEDSAWRNRNSEGIVWTEVLIPLSDMITFEDNGVAHQMHSEAAMAAARAQIVCDEANQDRSPRVNWQKEGF